MPCACTTARVIESGNAFFHASIFPLRAVEVGCSAFLTKGQDLATLLSTLRAADAGEALIPPNMLRRLLPRLSPTYRGVGRDLTAREIDVLFLQIDHSVRQAEPHQHLRISVEKRRRDRHDMTTAEDH